MAVSKRNEKLKIGMRKWAITYTVEGADFLSSCVRLEIGQYELVNNKSRGWSSISSK